MLCRFVVLIPAALALAAAADNGKVQVVEEIAAKVNGDIVTKGDLDEIRDEAIVEYQQKGASAAQLNQVVQQAMTDALRDKIDSLLLVQKAKDLNISVDSDVTREMSHLQTQSRQSDPDKFADWIRHQYGVSVEEYKQKLKESLMAQRVVSEEIGNRIFISDDDMKKYYEDHKAQYVRQEEVFLSQILLSTDGKSEEQTASAEIKAKDLVKRARAGEKFSDLAQTNSDDSETAKNGGYLGSPWKREELRPEMVDIVFSHDRGYITDPIKLTNPSGFVILKIEDRYAAGQATFDEVRDEIQGAMAGPLMEPKLRAYLTNLRREAYLEIHDGYVDAGAAPGQDTSWHVVAEIKPQTTTKEEVAARQRKRFMGLIPYGKPGDVKPLPIPGAVPADQPAKPDADTQPPANAAPAPASQPAPSAPVVQPPQ